MGVERAVTRWYVQRQILLNEIAELEAKLQPSGVDAQQTESIETAALKRQISDVLEKLRLMGSCPKPMMG
jgi:hypothetical protein